MPVNIIPRPEVLRTGQTVAQSAATASQGQQRDAKYRLHKTRNTTTKGPVALHLLVAEAGYSAPELVGIPYQNFSAIQRHTNYQWRKDNHKCTACGHDGHSEAGCLMWKGIQNQTAMNDIAYRKAQEEAQLEQVRVQALKYVPIKSGKCYLVQESGAIPRELRDLVWLYAMVHDTNVIRRRINAYAGMQVVPRCLRLNRQIHYEACGVILKLIRVVIYTGAANDGLRKWMEIYHTHDLVRTLEFPLFHCFNPGQYSGAGHLYDQQSRDVNLMLQCAGLRKVTFKLKCAGMACAYVVQRYSLNLLLGCENLKELAIDLAARNGGAPADFDSGEEVAKYCRDMFVANGQKVLVTTKHIRGR
ncbi:hypothetical protein EG327_004483 [Venturia inaequalis]|uniref:Uncharacterized protein n=1 Tax=Venturia inaequalis TaxID=5025 RepID=A0A8H3VFJ5_VENIN|nr:hypothetical protein EG327_004483 [Venturia inaequalis]